MQLMTKALSAKFPRIYAQEDVDDPIVYAVFFNPVRRQYWFATEFDPIDRIFFGYTSLHQDFCDEFGYFSLADLESAKVPVSVSFGSRVIRSELPIERDYYFTPKPLSEACAERGITTFSP
jgi:hypothetical protein